MQKWFKKMQKMAWGRKYFYGIKKKFGLENNKGTIFK